jgi:alcohol dehydrogenase
MNRVWRSAVFHGPDIPFELKTVELGEPRASEILVRVRCCTICGSDLHTFTGRRSTPTPTILGHEIVGEIEAFGPEASRVDLRGEHIRVGSRITWTIAASCGTCFCCRRSFPQKCDHLFKYGHERITPQNPLNGGLAEAVILPHGTGIVALPKELPDEVACPANCAIASVAAGLRMAQGCRDQIVLVQGAGMLGLVACAMAREGGARAVICCDVSSERLALAKRFGATHISGADPVQLRALTQEVSDRRGVDVVLELTGSPDAIEAGLPLLAIGGRYIWMGTVAPTRPINLNPESIVRGLINVHGVHNYIPDDLVTAVNFLTAFHRSYPFGDLVSRTFPLEMVDQAFAVALNKSIIRVALKPLRSSDSAP